MNASSPTTLPIKAASNGYIPLLNPATATIEETDAWILALGGEPLSPEQIRAVAREVTWAHVPGENPGDPDFPLAAAFLQ
jgi:hypothetical protein